MKIRGITRNVVLLGWVSFFTDLASEALYPIMPLFLVGLTGSPFMLGWIDGVAEGISSGLRWMGGAMSDRYRCRKPFVAAGYALSALSKPVMGLAALVVGWPLFLVGRASDRLGKSLRTSARDALIADSSEPAYRGIAFGFHRAMDTAGAVLGPLLSLALIIGLVGYGTAFSAKWATDKAQLHQSRDLIQTLPLHWVFFVAVIPGLISVALAGFGVKEIAPQTASSPGGKPPALFQRFPRAFWHLLAANALFSLGNSSDSFLILRSGEVGLSFGHILLAFALYNTVYALAAMPLGHLSDRVGRKPVIVCGWLTYALVYLGFAWFRSPLAPWLLFVGYGLYQALSEGVSKAMISDVVPSHQRAGAIGLFYTASGVGQLIASILAGATWHLRLFDQRLMLAFTLGAVFALVAVPIIATAPLRPRANPASAGTS